MIKIRKVVQSLQLKIKMPNNFVKLEPTLYKIKLVSHA